MSLMYVEDLSVSFDGFKALDVKTFIIEEKELRELIPSLTDERHAVRRCAARVLGRRGVGEAVPHLAGALKDGNGHVRGAAARALGEIGDKIAIAPLVSLLGDPYPDVRQAGVAAIFTPKDYDVTAILGALLEIVEKTAKQAA